MEDVDYPQEYATCHPLASAPAYRAERQSQITKPAQSPGREGEQKVLSVTLLNGKNPP